MSGHAPKTPQYYYTPKTGFPHPKNHGKALFKLPQILNTTNITAAGDNSFSAGYSHCLDIEHDGKLVRPLQVAGGMTYKTENYADDG